MANITINVVGLSAINATLAELGPATQRFVFGPALTAQARVVAKAARRLRQPQGFNDSKRAARSVARDGKLRQVRLRKTIRTRQRRATYGGKQYQRGRAAVYAGGQGARQGYLVHEGHGGPRPAPPHRYLTNAILTTQNKQLIAFSDKARERFPAAVLGAKRTSSGSVAVASRTVARRGRR